jgi:hypothetical protein
MVTKRKEFVSAGNRIEKKSDSNSVSISFLEMSGAVPVYREVHKILFLS